MKRTYEGPKPGQGQQGSHRTGLELSSGSAAVIAPSFALHLGWDVTGALAI